MDKQIIERAVEAAAKAMSEHWRDMHTNESLGYQRMLAQHAVTAALAEVESSNRVTIQRLDDFKSLRGRLDDLNESGAHPDLVLLDAHGAPALVGLSGPYAEGTFAVRGNPWDCDIDWGGNCSHCRAQSGAMSSAEALDFPVYVVEQEDK